MNDCPPKPPIMSTVTLNSWSHGEKSSLNPVNDGSYSLFPLHPAPLALRLRLRQSSLKQVFVSPFTLIHHNILRGSNVLH